MEQIKKIKDLTNEELKQFFSQFNFNDYDFHKQGDTIELRVYNKYKDKNIEYIITDNKAYGPKEFARTLEKKFKAFCGNTRKTYEMEK